MPKLADKPTPVTPEPEEAIGGFADVLPSSPSGVTEPVTRATLADQPDELNILWYGDGGTGKTTDIAAMANAGKIILINAERGIKRRPLEKLGIKVSNIEVVPDPNGTEELTYDLLDRLFWELKADLESGNSEYVGVGWDSITEISKVVLGRLSAKRAAKAARTGRGSADPYFTDLDDYRGMAEMMRPMVRHYRDLPCHFAASALERRDTDDDGKVLYRPAMSPALNTDVYGYMDIVVHTRVEADPTGGDDDIYMGLTRPIGKYRAKDRLKALPRMMAEPTFERVMGYVTETIEYDNDPIQNDAKASLAAAKSVPADDESDED